MKTTRIFTTLLLLIVTLSCSNSSDGEEMHNEDVTFEGIWLLRDITDFTLDGSALPVEASQEIRAFVELIVDEGCEYMAFEFKTDQSFILEQYDPNDFNPTQEEVEYVVNCENIDTFIGTWELQNDQLILSGDEDESSAFSVRFESGKMILEDVPLAAILPINGEGDFVFVKLGNG